MRLLRSQKKRKRKPIIDRRPFSKRKRTKLTSGRKQLKIEFFFRKHYVHFKYFFYLLISVSMIYLGHFVIIESKLFRITNVNITNAGEYVNHDDLRVMAENQLIGKNFFFTNTMKIKNILLENFLGAKDILIEKNFPNSILINVTEREPVAVLKSLVEDPEDDEYIIDLDGYVLGYAGNNFDHLPHINYSHSVKIGEFLSSELVPLSFTIIKEIELNDLKVETLNFYEKYTELITSSGTTVLISSDKDIKNSIKVAASLEKELNLKGKNIQKIDLRYDKVIVSYD